MKKISVKKTQELIRIGKWAKSIALPSLIEIAEQPNELGLQADHFPRETKRMWRVAASAADSFPRRRHRAHKGPDA